MNIKFFKEEGIGREFEQNGFVKVPIFTLEEVTEFKHYLHSLSIHDKAQYGFHVGIDELNNSLRASMNDYFREKVYPKISTIFEQPQFFTGSFLIKEAYQTGTVAAHQDFTFVSDEDSYQSIMCWVSLDHATIDNGAMAFIKGSHQFFSQKRGFPCPLMPEPVEEFRYTLMPYMNVIETLPGEVLIFDNKTIHGSFPNTTKSSREAISITLTHQDAVLNIYYLHPTKKSTVVQYKVDNQLFSKYNNPLFHEKYNKGLLLDDLEVVAEYPMTPEKKSWEDMQILLAKNNNSYHQDLVERFGKIIEEQSVWHDKNLKALRNPDSSNKIINKLKKLIGLS